MGFGRGKGFSPVIPDVEPAEPSVGTNDCQLLHDLDGHACQYWNVGSQIFTPDHTYTATGLCLMLSQYDTTRKGPLIVKIEGMAVNCWEGEVLWSKALYSTDLPLPDVDSITFLPLPNLVFQDSTPYRITVHTTPGWFSFVGGVWVVAEAQAAIRWRSKADTNPYPRGNEWYGCNYSAGSGFWNPHYDNDNVFCILDVVDPTIKHLDLQVAASTDDCYTYNGTILLNSVYLRIDRDTATERVYARFLDVTIPSGATILHASIEVLPYGITTGASDIQIRGIKEPNTLTFSTQADADGRPVTDAYKDWVPGNWAIGTWYGRFNDSVDLKDIIQEVIDQAAWASGNALAIKTVNTTLTRVRWCRAWDTAPNDIGPKLHIEYRE